MTLERFQADPLDEEAVQAEIEARVTEATRLAEELPEDNGTPTRGTAAGDRRKLRGLPAIGRGVDGAIAGTTPGDGLDDWPQPGHPDT